MMSAGMMGGYTYTVRGGVFCNAQTANVVLMSIAFGQGRFTDGLYFLIPISAYMLGAFISEALPVPIKKLRFLRWDTYLIIFEFTVLLIIGFIPLSAPNQITQVVINFIASMQYNTFRRAQGVPMATTFCTNHISDRSRSGKITQEKGYRGIKARPYSSGNDMLFLCRRRRCGSVERLHSRKIHPACFSADVYSAYASGIRRYAQRA